MFGKVSDGDGLSGGKKGPLNGVVVNWCDVKVGPGGLCSTKCPKSRVYKSLRKKEVKDPKKESSLGFSVLPEDTLARSSKSNIQPSDRWVTFYTP